jgi:hypothetical protein
MLANVGVFASMALAANAILLPPQLAADSPDDDKAMEALAVDPFKRSVALECPGCPSASLAGDVLQWTQGTGNTFVSVPLLALVTANHTHRHQQRLDFETGAFEDTLEIDGVQLYPPPFGSFFESFHVTQINPDNPEAELVRLRVSGYRLDYNSAQTVTEAGVELLPMTFRIASIESEPVNPPALSINLLKDASGRLMIASFETAPIKETDEEKECNEWPLLCKWRAAVAEKINSMKSSMRQGCHKHKGDHMQQGQGTEGQTPHGAEPGHHPHHRPQHSEGEDYPHHHGHHGHHGQAHRHRMHMFLRRAFFTILIPILIGVIAGTLTYLIGMALGCVIAIVVAKVRGHTYQAVSLEDGDDDEQDEPRGEKEVYAELPEYDSPPVYEEAAEKEVVDEAR